MGFQIENGVLKNYTEEPGVTEIVVPEGVTKIGWYAFELCTSLTSITIPDSVTEIGRYAFSGTPWLENYPNDLVIVGNGILYKYKGSGDIKIPDSVTKIGGYAFERCTSLTSITIPDSVTKIGKEAFSHTSVERVVIENETIKICESAFDCAYSFRIIVFPKGMDKIDYKWFGYDGGDNPVGIVITCLFRTVGVLNKKIKNFNEVKRKNFAADLIEFIKANIEVKALKDTNLSKAADYILDHPDDFSNQQIEEFLTAAKKKKSEKAIEVVEAYYNTLGVEENTSYPEFREIFKESSFDAVLRNCPEAVKIMSRVQFADGNSVDDVYIVKCAVMPYYLQVKPLEKTRMGL